MAPRRWVLAQILFLTAYPSWHSWGSCCCCCCCLQVVVCHVLSASKVVCSHLIAECPHVTSRHDAIHMCYRTARAASTSERHRVPDRDCQVSVVHICNKSRALVFDCPALLASDAVQASILTQSAFVYGLPSRGMLCWSSNFLLRKERRRSLYW